MGNISKVPEVSLKESFSVMKKMKQAKNLITRQKGIDHERFQHECIHGNEGEVDTLLRQRGYQAPTPHKHFFWNACFDVLSHFLHGPQKKKKKKINI